MTGKLRISEVAAQTGLSIATVSRVLAGKANVSAATRERVLKAAYQQGVMQNLSQGRLLLNSLTLFAPARAFDVRSDIFYHRVMQGIGEAVRPYDVRVRHCKLEEIDSNAGYFLEQMSKADTDAAILIGIDDANIHELAADLSKPVVLINCLDKKMRLPAVSPDHFLIGNFSASHLFQLGHRNVVTLQCLRRYTMELRVKGICTSWEEHDLAFRKESQLIVTEGFSSAETEALVKRRFTSGNEQERPTALLAGGDFMAAGAMKALRSLGLRVPHDVSVMSMDGFNLAEVEGLPLTTVHVPREELGAEAVRVLRQRLLAPMGPSGNLLLGGQLVAGATVRRIKPGAGASSIYQNALYD